MSLTEHEFFKTDNGVLYKGHVLDVLKNMEDESIDCVLTSPPYWGLRDYGTKGEIWAGEDGCKPWHGELGLEPTFELYINHLVSVFDEVQRVLKKTGTCWVNLGDTYMGNSTYERGGRQGFNRDSIGKIKKRDRKVKGKSLCMIPGRFAIQMIEKGWILRNKIVWHKPNCMPSNVRDRFTTDFEYLLFFTKSKKYNFQQQFESYAPDSDVRYRVKLRRGKQYNCKSSYKKNTPYHSIKRRTNDADGLCVGGFEKRGRNHRAVWSIPTKPFKDAHCAVFPEELCETPILSGCPADGMVLDMFFGSGTVGVVAEDKQRKWCGIEINPKYCEIAKKRILAKTKQMLLPIPRGRRA